MSQNDAPVGGIPLRWRLGLTTSLIVTIVLGTLTWFVQTSEIRRGRLDRETLLGQAAAPLASDIESAGSLDEIRGRLERFRSAHRQRGYGRLHAEMKTARGDPGDPRLSGPVEEPPRDALRAQVPVRTPLLPGGRATLYVWQEGDEFRDLVERRWKFWLFSLATATATILLSLYFAWELLIGRPLGALLDGVRKMELGYWGGVEIPRGAWEMRWLAYRFRNLGSQLEETVRRLVEAERRALLGLSSAPPAPGGERTQAGGEGPEASPKGAPEEDALFRRKLVRRYLAARCRYLEARGPGDAGARTAARETWERDVLEAERLGEGPLKARLEDAALRILEPEAFEEIRRRVAALAATQKKWLGEREKGLRRALAEARVRHRAVHHRVKHTAGVWRKMKSKGLALQQVHDVVAFRIIVPAELDCYGALKAVHDRFEPLLLRFKDYVAEPKPNGYRSLHTCVKAPDGVVFEVQIRTAEMHVQAEGGDAAHWRYKAASAWPAPGGVLGVSLAELSRALRLRRFRPGDGRKEGRPAPQRDGDG